MSFKFRFSGVHGVPVPVRYQYLGDRVLATTKIARAKAVMSDLDRHERLALSNLPGSAKRYAIRRVVLDDGTVITAEIFPPGIPVKGMSGGLEVRSVLIDTRPAVVKPERQRPCRCCGDCFLIGKIASEIFITNPNYRSADVMVCAGSKSNYLMLANTPIIDSNAFHEEGDRVVVYADPGIADTGDLTFTTNHQVAKLRRKGDTVRVFNCMSRSGLNDEEADYADTGIDDTVYTTGGSACTKRQVIDDPEGDPIVYLPIFFFITSIGAEKCFEFIE